MFESVDTSLTTYVDGNTTTELSPIQHIDPNISDLKLSYNECADLEEDDEEDEEEDDEPQSDILQKKPEKAKWGLEEVF